MSSLYVEAALMRHLLCVITMPGMDAEFEEKWCMPGTKQ
jgi:hypothetical protein